MYKHTLGLGLVFFLCAGAMQSVAQNQDSSFYRANRVKKELVMLFLPGFEHKRDTCAYEEKWYDEQGRLTRSKRNEKCKGYPGFSELKYTYNEQGNIEREEYTYDDKMVYVKKWSYDSFDRQVREEAVYFEPYNEAITTKKYYGEIGVEDSIYVTVMAGNDTTEYVEYQTFLEGLVMATSVRKMGSEKPITGTMHDYYPNRKIKKFIFMDYVGDGDNIVTLYTYNDENRVSETLDDVNNLRAEFYYNEGGLLIKSAYFNRFGAPDQELFHTYEFYK